MQDINSTRGAPRCRTRTKAMRVAGLALALGMALQANAQSITGGLYGSTNQDGASVQVTRDATGFSKTISVNRNGQYSLDQLAPGIYQVKVMRDGQVLSTQSVAVVANAASAVPSAGSTAATELEGVTVKASVDALNTVINPIDVSTPELSSIYTADLLADLPVSQTSIYALARLDSGSVMGNSYAQIGGASETENRYYFNEFDTSYDVTGAGAIVFPQVAVASTQLITGSGGLGWTSTTGGISSATLRQGSNEIHGGYSLYYTAPTSRVFSPRGQDRFNALGTPSLYQSDNSNGHNAQHYAWGSGPLIRDRLFAYVLYGRNPGNDSRSYTANTRRDRSVDSKEGLVNLTWNISDDQSLNVTAYRNQYDTNTHVALAESGSVAYDASRSTYGDASWSGLETKQKLIIGNYKWRINDNLRVRLMAGSMRYDYKQSTELGDVPYVGQYDYATYTETTLSAGDAWKPLSYYFDKKGFKGDLTWNFGDHEVVLGGEIYRNNYYYQPETNPVGYYYYYLNYPYAIGSFTPPGNVVYKYEYKIGGEFESRQKGVYMYDTWQVSPNIRVMLGARWDQMQNMTSTGTRFLDMDMLSPRLGVSWDVRGDSSLKVGANVGRYTLPMPSTLSYLIASAQTYKLGYYTYTGRNPDGTPTGLTPVANYVYYDGTLPEMSAVVSRNMKNTYQNEYQVYLQQQLTPTWSFLGQAAFHDLKRIVDQTCDQDGRISDYVRDNGHPGYGGLTGGGGCIEFNPGSSIVLRDYLDGGDTLKEISIPNSYLQMPKAKRRYLKLGAQLSHQRSEDEPYFLNLSYTWSHRYGNHDGYTNLTRSTDPKPGTSGNYDFLQNTFGSSGNLSGDQRHNLIANGVYYFGNGLRAGSVLSIASGISQTCLGVYPDNSPEFEKLVLAGAMTHYCNGVLSPQGGAGRTDSTWRWDMSVGYDFSFGRDKGQQLSLDLSVTNLTNNDAVTRRDMTSSVGLDASGKAVPLQSYRSVTALQAPRSTSLYLRYSF